MARAIASLYVYNNIDYPAAFLLDILQTNVTGTAHCQMREAADGVFGAVGMNRSQRTTMAGIESVEKNARLSTANLANDDPVGPVSERCFEQVGKADLALVRIELGFGGDDVRLPYI